MKNSMDFTLLAKQRYSCRKFSEIKPERQQLINVLETARLAPSSKNMQPWKYVVLDDDIVLDKVKEAYGREWISSAPAIIVVCGDYASAWKRPADSKIHTDIDVAITIDHLTLAATDQGLATCWICLFDPQEIGEILDIQAGWEAVAIIPIGYSTDEPNTERHEKLRKPLDEIVSFNQF